jgi:hypothetical protein
MKREWRDRFAAHCDRPFSILPLLPHQIVIFSQENITSVIYLD